MIHNRNHLNFNQEWWFSGSITLNNSLPGGPAFWTIDLKAFIQILSIDTLLITDATPGDRYLRTRFIDASSNAITDVWAPYLQGPNQAVRYVFTAGLGSAYSPQPTSIIMVPLPRTILLRFGSVLFVYHQIVGLADVIIAPQIAYRGYPPPD